MGEPNLGSSSDGRLWKLPGDLMGVFLRVDDVDGTGLRINILLSASSKESASFRGLCLEANGLVISTSEVGQEMELGRFFSASGGSALSSDFSWPLGVSSSSLSFSDSDGKETMPTLEGAEHKEGTESSPRKALLYSVAAAPVLVLGAMGGRPGETYRPPRRETNPLLLWVLLSSFDSSSAPKCTCFPAAAFIAVEVCGVTVLLVVVVVVVAVVVVVLLLLVLLVLTPELLSVGVTDLKEGLVDDADMVANGKVSPPLLGVVKSCAAS